MNRRNFYNGRVVIGLLVAMRMNSLRCDRKPIATLVATVMQLDIYTNLAQ